MKILHWPEGKESLTIDEIKKLAVEKHTAEGLGDPLRGPMIRIDDELYFIVMTDKQIAEAKKLAEAEK